MKNKIKRLIAKLIIKRTDVDIINDKIIVTIDCLFSKYAILELNNKVYKNKKNKFSIPYNTKNIQLLMNNHFRLGYQLKGRRFFFKLNKSKIIFKAASIKIKDKYYYYTNDSFVEINEISLKNNEMKIDINFVSLDVIKHLYVYIIDSKYNIIKQMEVTENFLNISNVNTLFDKQKMQIVFVSDNKTYYISSIKERFLIENYVISLNENRLYAYHKFLDNYTFETKNKLSQIPPLKPRYYYIKNVRYDHSNTQFIITSNDKNMNNKYVTFKLFLKSMKTRKRELLFESPKKDIYLYNDMEKLLNRKINYIDRYLLEYEILDKNCHVVERNYLKIETPKKRRITSYVLEEMFDNHISFLNKNYIVIENKNNHFLYNEKFDFDFNSASFTTDFEIISYENHILKMNLHIISLLSPISSVTIFVSDNYQKHTYFLYEEKFYTQETTIKNHEINIDMHEIEQVLYYNIRLNFKIGIVYNDGYSEQYFLVKNQKDYTTQERYLFEQINDNDMISAFYLGDNLYNLNLWYTSLEEYNKGVMFQSGKETYYETMNNENVDPYMILFEANLGKNYTGNPKYLYEYMLKNDEYRNFKFIWVYPESSCDKIPGNPVLVKRGTKEYFYYLAKSKYWINNIRFPIKDKRLDTVYLNTWHGTPLKKLGFDIECEGPEKQAFGDLYRESQNWDFLLVDNDYGEEKLVGAFKFKKRVIKKGYPINDIYYDEERIQNIKNRLKNAFPVINDKKVILYAPTWRDLKGDYVRGYEFELPFDIEKLYENLNNDYVILVKLHHLISDNLVINNKFSNFIINVSHEEDVMELLSISDILITDYSSVFYDFASARKPILFYMYDLEEYLNETRGLYVDISTLPGPVIKDTDHLVKEINSISNNQFEYYEKLYDFCNDMAKYCHGTSCKDVLDIVIKKEDKS